MDPIQDPEPRKSEPIRCFGGNARPHEPFWIFRDAAESGSGQVELELYGVLSEYSWLDDDITPKRFKDQLWNIGQGGPVLLKINSPGGDVIAASVMRAIMSEYPGEITARVDGLAASAAVVVTMAAKHVSILDTAYMMIHDPAVVVFLAALDIETLGKLHKNLKSIKDGIVPVYSARTGLTEDRISRMMADETWMSARQAVDFGFADEVLGGGQKESAVGYVNVLRNYAHVPPELLRVAPPIEDILPALAASDPEADRIEHEAQTLRERVSQILSKE